ncbi:MAG: DNA (cytosine-5-)-methyltransferase [Symplocastrum torsivum CPER-KK1]|jgi:DNA (cytosine-5)-methyltransferase 1|uniref:DNA (cytosine-5-)-methyltransferase n=1 Tax=Symplocastrum torsivum CPER-KK1 TaxID=450513 RepID=A0A951PPG2_9CYAN|nr:DNA (cytosine-5-)-methyltransferase [Symplocastrum torsivum CPER-KK1]
MTQRVITAHQKAPSNAPVAVELFAGVGGFSLGMKAAGIDVALAVESDEQTLATYAQNFPSTSVLCADVQELTGLEIRRLLEVAQNQQGKKWDGKIGLVFGGPPCQGLSRIGKRDVNDPRNQLIAHFCRLVEELQPTAFVLENVPDLLLPKYAGLIEPSLQQLQQAGYNTWTWVLNALDYGVPQSRKRVFIGGILHHTSPQLPVAASQAVIVRDAIADLTFLSEEAFPQLFDTDELQLEEKQPTLEAQPSEYRLKLEQVFPSPPTTNPHLLTGCCLTRHTPSVVERFKATAPGTTEPESRLYRLKWDGVARTLRAGTRSDKGRHTAARPIHPTHARVLTVREAARLSSFPDWFRFHRRIWRGMRQVGNAVPPLLALAVGDAIYQCLTQLEGATAMETATLTGAIASGTELSAIAQISPTQKLAPGEHQLDPKLLKPHPRNAALYGEDESVSDLVELIGNSNWLKPLVITPDLIIISGHRRWKAALELGWLSIPVIVREFKDALASLEALLLENATREKTIEQKVREAALWQEIEQESAKLRQGTRRDIQENFPGCCEPFGQSRDHVAKRVGLGSGKRYQKAVKVVEEINKAVSSGHLTRAKALQSVLNQQSVDGAFKLTQKPVAQSDPILELIASGEVRTPKQAQSLLKNRQRLKERSLFTPTHEPDLSNLLSHHLTLEPGGLVEIYAPELPDWHQRQARIESVGEKQCKVWKRNVQTMDMELRSFPHADLTPLPLSEVPELEEISSRLKALYETERLDAFDRYILQSLERCVNLTPTEREYLHQIELRYQQGQQSTQKGTGNGERETVSREAFPVPSLNPSVPDVTPLHEHSIPVSSPDEYRLETLEFPLPPTLNEMIRTARGGWQASAKQKREWTELIASYCKEAYQFQGKIWLEYVWRVKNLARDNNNIAAATKYIDDGLVEAGVIADDSLKYIQSPVCHWYVQSCEDMVTVRVSNLPIYNGEPLATVGGLSGKHFEPDCSSQERYFTPLTVSALPLGATGAV